MNNINHQFTAFYHATLVKKDKKPNSKDNGFILCLKCEVIHQVGKYPDMEAQTITKGENKGKKNFTLNSFDYTKELPQRKVQWKLTGRAYFKPALGKKSSHISKVYPLTEDRAWIDFGKTSNDAAYLIFPEGMTFEKMESFKIFVAPNTKNDTAFRQKFANGDFDELLQQLEKGNQHGMR